MGADLDIVGDVTCELGEGPVWDPATGEIVWVDILAGTIHRHDPENGAGRRVEVGQSVGAAVLGPDHTMLAAVGDGFATVGADGGVQLVNPFLRDDTDLRMNDGKCDPVGRFVAGSISLTGRTGTSALYRLEDDGAITTLMTGVSVSNGLAWDDDGTRMYYIDTPARAVTSHRYDSDASTLAEPRLFVDTAEFGGSPDGMARDAEGNLWVAFWDGGRVRCFAPDGRLRAEVVLPVSRVTSCAFGGPDLDTLYITTAWTGLSPAQREREPLAGRLFRCRPGVRGQRVQPWRGLLA